MPDAMSANASIAAYWQSPVLDGLPSDTSFHHGVRKEDGVLWVMLATQSGDAVTTSTLDSESVSTQPPSFTRIVNNWLRGVKVQHAFHCYHDWLWGDPAWANE